MPFSYNPAREYCNAVSAPVTIWAQEPCGCLPWTYVQIDVSSWTEGICAEYFDWLAGAFHRMGIDRRYHRVVWHDDRENNRLCVRWRSREFDPT